MKQASDPALSCVSQGWKSRKTVVPELLDAGELEGSGEAIYQWDQKDALFEAEHEGANAKTFWKRTVVHERDCNVHESYCTSKMQSSRQNRSVRDELGTGDSPSPWNVLVLRVDEQEEKQGNSVRTGDGGTEPGQLNSLCRLPFCASSPSSPGNLFPKHKRAK